MVWPIDWHLFILTRHAFDVNGRKEKASYGDFCKRTFKQQYHNRLNPRDTKTNGAKKDAVDLDGKKRKGLI